MLLRGLPIRRWILNGVEKRNLYFQFKYKDPSKVTEFLKSKEEFLWLLMVVMTKEEDSSLITPQRETLCSEGR